MGPVSYLPAKKEGVSNVKLDKKDKPIETTMKTNEGVEPENNNNNNNNKKKNNDTRTIESTTVKPLEKEGAITTESSDYFLSQNNQE